MGLTWRQRFVLRMKMRYKFKRTYLTVAVPVILAVAILTYALYVGYAPLPTLGPIPSSSAGSSAISKLQEFELLFPNATVNGQNISSVAPLTKSSTPANPHNFYILLVGCLLVALGPYSADVTIKDRQLKKHENDFTDFLFELSELVRGGIDPIKAITTLSQGNVGSITKQVQMVAKQMQIGYTFEQSMRNLATTLKSPLVNKYVDLVVQASYSGGAVANLIQRASADMGTFLSIEREKKAGLAQYTVVLYTAQIVLIVLCAILVVEFLPDLKQLSLIGGTGLGGGILGQADIQDVNLEPDLFYLVIINGFLGGLVIGKISEGKLKHGIKHALVLILIGFLAWTLFVIPSTGGTTNYTFTITSYDHTGIAGEPLTDPITVQVNQTNGQPAIAALVSFAITGPGGGGGANVVPSSVNTDSNGQAQTLVVLGTNPGLYTVAITVGLNTTDISIEATPNPLSGGANSA